MANKDLADFLAHSVELESEAHERYRELSESMAEHCNDEVALFFSNMAEEASNHLEEVETLASGLELPDLKAWEYRWPGEEAPETASYEALHYRMSLGEAMHLALANERAAERYYRQMSEASSDSETKKLAADFADEERSHAAALEKMLESISDNRTHHMLEDDDPHMPE